MKNTNLKITISISVNDEPWGTRNFGSWHEVVEYFRVYILRMKNNDPIPDDLVLLPANLDLLNQMDILTVEVATWYETPDGFLLASAKEIDYLSESGPSEAGLEFDKSELTVVDDILKRSSLEDGFYHA
jgi:hypothetical protein